MSLRDGNDMAADSQAHDGGGRAAEGPRGAARGTDPAGVSGYNQASGFVPAFRNTGTGETRPSLFADGTPAPVHVLEGLPSDWVDGRRTAGEARRLADGIERGYLRGGCFHSLADAARVVAESSGD